MKHRIKTVLLLVLTAVLSSCAVFAEEETTAVPSFEAAEVAEDFYDLYETNPDTVGWLRVGDNIDYPVVQRDNDFYLHHDFYGNEDNNGTLFVNEYNSLMPRDWLVLIHGHHMRSGAMFGRLMDYEDFGYVCSHPLIMWRTVRDPEEVYYVPVSALNVSADEGNPDYMYVLEPLDFFFEESEKMREMAESSAESVTDVILENMPEDTESAEMSVPEEAEPVWPYISEDAESAEMSMAEEVQPDEMYTPEEAELEERIRARKAGYLEEIAARQIWEGPVDADADDDLLMLVTCSYYQTNGRFLLLCRKLREDETPEMIQSMFWEAMP